MQCREGFLVFLVSSMMISSGHCDDSTQFVLTKEEEVQTIAQAAQDNYVNTCEQLGTCLSPQNCSRLECYPFSIQSSETTCVYVDDNQLCTNKTGSACDTIEANFERGYVRTPPLNFTSLEVGGTLRQDREIYFGTTICTQRNLDETFMRVNQTLRSNSSLNYYYNLYFGSVDGTFRYYPGRESLNNKCGVYDPRIRPWYTGAISILKDVVVLLDTGSSMQETYFLDPSTTYMEITQSMISWFVQTLTGGDRVSVIPVNASGSYPGQPYFQYVLTANQPLNTTDPNFKGLLSYIQSSSTCRGDGNGNGGTTNFTDAFIEATSIFEDSSSPAKSMKISILVTNSQSGNTPDVNDLSAAADMKNLGSQLFVYDLNPNNTSNPSSWGAYACQNTQSQYNYAAGNPLFFLNPYFSFLVRARIAANHGTTPFWQTPYEDASDLGQVITVAYPAISHDGLLIGVAGIDVQLAGLDSDPVMKASVESLLTSSPYRLISENTQAANISICNAVYVNCPGPAGQTESLCYPSQQPASDKQLAALLCCQDCTSSGSHQDLALVISLSVLGALLALLIVSFTYLWRWSKRSKRRRLGSRRNELALTVYSYEVLRKATNGFAAKNVIGKGSFGVVYKAVLGDEMVAVKQLNQPADRAADFEAEINILGITSHPNLVELKGTCFQPTQCFLVYELVNNGDLHAWLWPVEKNGSPHSSDSEGERLLTWNKRRKIARGIARGLNYLHRGLQPNGAVYHLDIKPRNILLEYNFNPKIADFGISQLYEPGFTVKCASVVRGTFGYIAPEVLQGQMKPNSKLDVYSYGMVLLQLMSGRKIDDPEVTPFLLEWARSHVEDGYVEKVVDENLIATVQEEYREALMTNCKQMVRLALLCLSDRPEWRPEMSEVLETIDALQECLDLETPSFSDWEGNRSGPEDYETNTDEDFQIPRSASLKHLSMSRELSRSLKYFRSESGNEVETTDRNPEISLSVFSPGNAGKDRSSIGNPSKRCQDSSSTLDRSFVDKLSQDHGSGTLDRSPVYEGIQDGSIVPGRSSVDSSLKRALEMANVTRMKLRSRTMLSRSDSKFRMLRRSFSD